MDFMILDGIQKLHSPLLDTLLYVSPVWEIRDLSGVLWHLSFF